jgi:hypothetical protein
MRNNVLTRVSHSILRRWCNYSDKVFKQNINQLENIQRQKLTSILENSVLASEQRVDHYNLFALTFPVSRYSDWRDIINVYKTGKSSLSKSSLVRFQPTSGSSEQIKFIPYTKLFLDELDHAIAPWLASLYRKYPKLENGTHYWSVSWLPESQREVLKDKNLNDDSTLLSVGKRILSKFTQAVPSNVAFATNADDALFATICYLVADQNLSMISVWSPTFALQLLERIEQYKQEICTVLATGSWGKREVSLKNVKCPFSPEQAAILQYIQLSPNIDFKLLWPKLCLVSSWDTAGSKEWAKKLQQRLYFVQFEGKGLWSTEGVVTIPYNNFYPLAYQSHFYEFEYLEGEQQGKIIPSWELKANDLVSPIISTGNGLLRYCLDDCLRVTNFIGQIPCFEFQGRRFGVDMVGEKLAPEMAQQLLEQLSNEKNKAISLLAVDTQQKSKPFYCVLFEGIVSEAMSPDHIDTLLRQNFHYELARDLGQLDQPKILQVLNGWESYKQLVMHDGMIEGNIKPEPLKKITLNSFKQMC